jgi:HD-GYP domain-containing protein (c-di-GMP phosphodiesterase class II)
VATADQVRGGGIVAWQIRSFSDPTQVLAGWCGATFPPRILSMLSTAKLRAEQMQVGQPLAFDAFDEAGNLLLRKGFVIHDPRQLASLIERGLYRYGGAEPQAGGPGQQVLAAGKHLRYSVFHLLTELLDPLDQLLRAAPEPGFVVRMQTLALQLHRAVRLDTDAAIASILIQHEGRYSVRRMVHSAILCELMVVELGQSEQQRLELTCAALSMNIAMLDLQDVLYAQAGTTSATQRAQVHMHPQEGVAMLRARGVTQEAWLSLVDQHHETIDGQGYPRQLQGAAIERCAQLLSLADRYGAMATGRAYRGPALPNLVLKQIFMDKDKSVDAGLATLLVKTVGIYPPGSAVELANGDIAIVVKRTRNASQPVLRCVKTWRKEILDQPRKRMTHEPGHAIVRLIAASELGFALDPERLWDGGFEAGPTEESALA